MKKIFEFTVPREVTVKESDSTENEKGETVTTEKEVRKTINQEVLLKKPTRSLYDDAELYYGVILSEGIKAGLLTRALLAKRFNNDGGTMADNEKDEYADMYMKLFDIQNNLERNGLVAEQEKTDAQKKATRDDIAELTLLKEQIRNFEMNQASLFEQTAENRARNKTVLWWSVHLSFHQNDEGEWADIFPGETLEEKLNVYDSLEESEDEYYDLLLRKILYYVSFWYVGRASTQEEFQELLVELGESEGEPKVEEPAEEPAEEPKVEESKAEEEKAEPDKEIGVG